MIQKSRRNSTILTVVFTFLCVVWVYPIVTILLNSLKDTKSITTRDVFNLPNSQTFAGLSNYVESITGMSFLKSFFFSLLISVTSVALILLCCSMAAWYVVRVNSLIAKIFYYLCIFSTGLAVFMFTGFVKSIPLEIEEAAMIDGCSPIQTYFQVLVPILKPTIISTAILETMWVWNDYLLPTLVLDIKKYRTIPMAIQYFRGSYGTVNMGAMMASIMIDIIPIIIMYLVSQKYIIEGVIAGAVKG